MRLNNKNRKPKTNAEVLRAVLAIDEAYSKEHPEAEPILTTKFKEVIGELIAQYGDDPDVLNVKLNKVLKPSSQFIEK